MKIFEKKINDNVIGCWYHYYLFGKKIHSKLVHLIKIDCKFEAFGIPKWL